MEPSPHTVGILMIASTIIGSVIALATFALSFWFYGKRQDRKWREQMRNEMKEWERSNTCKL